MIFNPRKIITSFIFLLLFCLIFSRGSFAFSGNLDQFIRDNKKVRVRILQGQEQFDLIPYQDIEVNILPENENNKNVVLNKNRKYQFKVESAEKKYWKIQVFSTRNESQALLVKNNLAEKGFENLIIQQEKDWYKIFSGDYLSRDSAENAASNFKKEGWEPWIREFSEEINPSIKVYNSDQEKVFESKYFYLEGKINLNNKTYKDNFEFVLSDGKINIYNKTSFNSILKGVLNTKYGNMNNSELLKAETVLTRSYLLHEILKNNQGFLDISLYQGIRNLDEDIVKAVTETEGEIVGEIENDDILLEKSLAGIHKLISRIETGKIDFVNRAYPEILDNNLETGQLIDLNNFIQEKTRVNARVKWGLRYKEMRQLTWSGPRVITILDLDLEQSNLSAEAFISNNKLVGFGYLDEIVREEQALAAINGGYYNSEGKPLGLRMIDGKVITDSIHNRSGVAITEDGEILIDNIEWRGYINQDIKIDQINEKPGLDEIALINSYYGNSINIDNKKMKIIVIKNEKISEIRDFNDSQRKSTNIDIKDNEKIILARGTGIETLDKFTTNDEIELNHHFNSDWDNKNLKSIVQAGPRLIKKGKITITGFEEQFQTDVIQGRAPRSALGVTEDNHLILVSVDGRQGQLSIGMTLMELANFLKKLGLKEAVNLDGGYSTQMVVRGFTMNNPLQKRVITDGILIKDKRTD
ncbi:MAG: phosphodiester glycosidase family protein [Bacillota bacterium]